MANGGSGRLVNVCTISRWLRFIKEDCAHAQLYKSEQKNGYAHFCLCAYTRFYASGLVPIVWTDPHTDADKKKLRTPSFTVTTNTQQNKEINTVNKCCPPHDNRTTPPCRQTIEPLLRADSRLHFCVSVCMCVAVASDNRGQV